MRRIRMSLPFKLIPPTKVAMILPPTTPLVEWKLKRRPKTKNLSLYSGIATIRSALASEFPSPPYTNSPQRSIPGRSKPSQPFDCSPILENVHTFRRWSVLKPVWKPADMHERHYQTRSQSGWVTHYCQIWSDSLVVKNLLGNCISTNS